MAVELEPEVPTLFGEQLTLKRRAFSIKAGTSASLITPILDSTGAQIDARASGPFGGTWTARIYEAVSMKQQGSDIAASVDSDGIPHVGLPLSLAKTPGVYEVAVAAPDPDNAGMILHANEFYLYIEPSAWASQLAEKGPPPLDRLRLAIQDSDPIENELLQQRQFCLTDICDATVWAIMTFNCVPPKIARFARTTQTFENWELLLPGIQAFLAKRLVEFYRKNRLQYQAAGIALDDNRLQEYTAAYVESMKQFEASCTRLKAQWNLDSGFGIIGGFRNRMRSGMW